MQAREPSRPSTERIRQKPSSQCQTTKPGNNKPSTPRLRYVQDQCPDSKQLKPYCLHCDDLTKAGSWWSRHRFLLGRLLVEPPSILTRSALGGADRDRTGDLLLAKQALSQLSYGPRLRQGYGGLTPGACADRKGRPGGWPCHPKPRRGEGWWAWEDLNFRPHAYQARALTN